MLLKGFIITLLGFVILNSKASCQFYNNGSTIKIQEGAFIFLQGDFYNNAGSISNDGKIEVQGSFFNNDLYTSLLQDDTLILSGVNNVFLKGGTATLSNLEINKTAFTNRVTLTGDTKIGNTLNYVSGIFSTDPLGGQYVLSAPVTATFSFSNNSEIVGKVKRTNWTNGASVIFNSPNMSVQTASGTEPIEVTVNMIPGIEGGDPALNEREVKRKYELTQTGGNGFTAQVRFPYSNSEVNTNTESELVPWKLFSSTWNAFATGISRDISFNYVNLVNITAADFNNEWKLADPNYIFNATVFLRGSWNTGTGQMNTSINSILPLTQPYNDPAFGNYNGGEAVAVGFFASHTNITDWVLIDFRIPASGIPADANASTAVGRKAAFLLNNGAIVNLDGITPVSIPLNKQGAGYMVIRHRNHLAVMSNLLFSNPTETFSNDFTVNGSVYTNTLLSSPPVQLLTGTSPVKYGLWAGNANKDGVLNAGDIGLVKANANSTVTGYSFADVNMDGVVNAGDIGLTKSNANVTAQTHSSRNNTVPSTRKASYPISHIAND